jgi:hypothetical protein
VKWIDDSTAQVVDEDVRPGVRSRDCTLASRNDLC